MQAEPARFAKLAFSPRAMQPTAQVTGFTWRNRALHQHNRRRKTTRLPLWAEMRPGCQGKGGSQEWQEVCRRLQSRCSGREGERTTNLRFAPCRPRTGCPSNTTQRQGWCRQRGVLKFIFWIHVAFQLQTFTEGSLCLEPRCTSTIVLRQILKNMNLLSPEPCIQPHGNNTTCALNAPPRSRGGPAPSYHVCLRCL